MNFAKEEAIRLESSRLVLTVDPADGRIRGLFDKVRGIAYVEDSRPAVPFRLAAGGGTSADFRRFTCEVKPASPEETKAVLRWDIRDGLAVTGEIVVSSASADIQFRSEVSNATDDAVEGLEYPIVPNIRRITDGGENDYVAHSFATGIRVRNPLKHFAEEGAGFRHMPYPESFSGASMQFFAYYGLGRGGLYFAAHDGEGYAKWLNFYGGGNGLLEASFYHACEEIGSGKGMRVGYPVVVRALDGDDWHEAADRYKEWAVNQFWCRQGELPQAMEESGRWLHEKIGAATFGINAMHDRSAWIDRYRAHIETPIFHILGPDWVHDKQTFGSGVPGGMADWFPTRFHPANLRAMKEHGDKYAPFEFDYLYDFQGADGEQGKAARQLFPGESALRSIDKYKFPLICPAAPYTRQFHVRRDERLQEEADVDAIYYDISANNILKVCLDESHGHPVGAGRQITQAYRMNYANTKAAMREKAGRYVPMGTEMMNEVFLDVLDYYQSRAGGRPAAPLEGWNVRDLLYSGEAQLIPMFTYVYHEYGALRLDGWGKLVEEIGDLFFYTAARTYLWGGLYEINHEYSPMEAIDGKENAPEEHYYPFEPRGYELSPDRARYIGMLAKLRTGVGNKYLAYGKMLRPLRCACDRVALDWFHYNCDKNFKEYEESGAYEAEAVVHAAWQYRRESVGFFFANVTDDEREVTVDLDLSGCELPGETLRVKLHAGGKWSEWPPIRKGRAEKRALTVPAKTVVLLEVW